MRDEQRGDPFLGEWIDRVQRLGRRARLELDEFAGLLEADQRVGKAVRRVAELGRRRVGKELPLRREEETDDRRGERAEREQQGPLEEAADPACLDDRAGEDRDRALNQDVAIADVDELVREDAL